MVWKLDAARLVCVGKMRDFEGVEEQSMVPSPNRSPVEATVEECFGLEDPPLPLETQDSLYRAQGNRTLCWIPGVCAEGV